MKNILLVILIKDSLVEEIIPCRDSKLQEKVFRDLVISKSGYEPEDCDYEDGYYEYEKGGSICITSVEVV